MNHHVDGELHNDCDYDSDKIDSDIEEMLYASVHHQTIGTPELSFKCSNADPNTGQNDQEKLSNHLNWSTPIVCKIQNHRKTIKKQNSAAKRQKQKHPSEDDLTICQGKKSKLKKKTASASTTFNISYGNNILLDRSDMSKNQNQFYSEDSCDSIEDIRKKLPSDKRYWKILKKDYHTRRTKSKQCHHCFSASHLDRDCPNKIRSCFICGGDDHRQKSCDKKRICSICFQTGHLSKSCLEKIRCKLCHMVGHGDDKCTFHWRKYLTKTREEDLDDDLKITKNSDSALRSRSLTDQVSINERISCYNCGMNGSHFAHECKSITINRKRFEIPSPIFNLKPDKNKNANKQTKRLASSEFDNAVDSSDDDSLTYVMDILQQTDNREQSKFMANGKPDKCKKMKKTKKKPKRFKRTVKPTEMTKPIGKKSTKLKRK